MNITALKIKQDISLGEQFRLHGIADLHFGSKDFNRRGYFKDMDRAYKNSNHILIIGDVFDAIFTKDKRYSPSTSTVAQYDDQLNRQVDEAFELLKPYADKIILISAGNHEYSILKYSSVDILKILVYKLNKECNTNIAIGGYSGYIYYSFKVGDNHSLPYKIYYNHGSGGNARVSKGMINFSRIRTDFNYDCCLLGHLHSKIADTGSVKIDCNSFGNITKSQQLHAFVGTFKNLVNETTEISWEDTKGFPAVANGGITLIIEPETDRYKYNLRANLIV